MSNVHRLLRYSQGVDRKTSPTTFRVRGKSVFLPTPCISKKRRVFLGLRFIIEGCQCIRCPHFGDETSGALRSELTASGGSYQASVLAFEKPRYTSAYHAEKSVISTEGRCHVELSDTTSSTVPHATLAAWPHRKHVLILGTTLCLAQKYWM